MREFLALVSLRAVARGHVRGTGLAESILPSRV